VRSLELHGVDVVFGIPGTHNLPIYEALGGSRIRHVTARHEQGAGYAADGYARASGRPGVVVVTTGPAVLNAATAAAQAWSDSVPLLLVAPGMPLSHPTASTGYLHEAPDQRLAMSGAVARAVRVESHGELARELADAFASFASERPRARFVEIPLDLLGREAACTPLAAPAIAPRSVDPAALARAAELLGAARRPLVLAGGGSHGAATALADLLDRGVPVMTTINGKGVVDERHPLALGARLQVPAGRRLVEAADVLLVVGSDLGELHQWGTVQPAGRIIRVDLDPAEVHGNAPSDVALVGDAGTILSALSELLPASVAERDGDWERSRAEADRELAETGRPWSAVAAALESALAPGDVLCADNAMVAYNGLLGPVRLGAGSRFLFPSGFGTLGYALPAAIGAKLARPDRRVAAVLGDGGIMFTLSELATAADLGLPLPVVVSVNGGYGEIRREMREGGFEPLAVDLPVPDLPAVARALGGHGVALASADALGEALEAAFARPGPTLITVPE
jgi:thiamine pyrophosphate-dependent acetolactate synthase large subunit-like protein